MITRKLEDASVSSAQGRGIFLEVSEAEGPAQSGGAGVNRLCAEIVRSAFPVVDDPLRADLRVKAFSWDGPTLPRRLFIDHGSFADASFWTYSSPKLRIGDTILVSSSVCVEVARRFLLSEGPRVLCVPFSVDTDLFRPAVDRVVRRRALEDELGVGRDGPLLLVVSTFIRRKNQHLAVLFLRALLDEVPDARLAFVGGVPPRGSGRAYRDDVQDLVQRAGVSERVDFLGELPHARLSRCMAGADLLVHFSNCRLENFGLVVGEAMAAGLPVLAADWGGLRDLVVAGETGVLAATYLSERGPRTDWLSAVGPASEILKDRHEWSRNSRNARNRAELELSASAYRSRLCAAVEAALARPPDQGALALTEPATDLMFRTMALNATHPEIVSTGDEYRLLMTLDAGRHYRFLTGPVASAERAPEVGAADRLYPVVTWSSVDSGIRVTDPAWPGDLPIDETQRRILDLSDGSRPLGQILEKISSPGHPGSQALRSAQALVDQGLLCPLGAVAIRQRTG
jgi:glycosyltransferase involved in cell wall biosynthesis